MSTNQDSSFLGSLRSELDDSDDVLHPYFSTLVVLSDIVRVQYSNWKLKPEVAARVFQTLRLTDIDGREWTVGAITGGWFRRDNAKSVWSPSLAPTGVTPTMVGVPDWVDNGLERILAENLTDSTSLREEDSSRKETVSGADTLIGINPFQRQDSIPIVAIQSQSRAVSSGDNDWLLDEWANAETVSSASDVGADNKEMRTEDARDTIMPEQLYLPPED